jgi:hypothetical protein
MINGSTTKPRKKPATGKPVVPVDLRKVGPKMAALPNDMWRAAAAARFLVKPGRGGNVAAARAAGFAATGKPGSVRRIAYGIFHDPRMLEALHELGELHLKAGVPDAIGTVHEIMADRGHKDRLAAAKVFIDRAHPATTLHHHLVEHKIDYTQQALEELAAFRRLGVARAKLEEIFGRDGLYHLEQQLDAAKPAKLIEGQCA